jgi:hypothetical protein
LERSLLKSDVEYNVVLVDASETAIQRPKKTAPFLLRQEEETYVKKPNCCS